MNLIATRFGKLLSNLFRVKSENEYAYNEFTASLANGASISSGWIDTATWSKYQFGIKADVAGLTQIIYTSEIDGGGRADDITTTTPLDLAFTFPILGCRQRYLKLEIKNETGSAVANVGAYIKAMRGGGDGASVFPTAIAPSDFTPAMAVQAILQGRDYQGVFNNVLVNSEGAIFNADFNIEVLRERVNGVQAYDKFGKNTDIDTGSTPEDVIYGGGIYTGIDSGTVQTIGVRSSSANDAGTLVTSGTATSGSATIIEDTTKDFVALGVTVLDIVVNDTKQVHGVVLSVATTALTVIRFTDGGDFETTRETEAGDSYRIASPASTGAFLVRLQKLLDGFYVGYSSEYIILNGTTEVFTTGTYLRNPTAKVIGAGSAGASQGDLTGRQSATTSNIFWIIPQGNERTIVAADTVPAGKTLYLKVANSQMGRANGSAGSASVKLLVREVTGVWSANIDAYITNSVKYESPEGKVIALPEYTDYKWQVDEVSDNNTVVTAETIGILVDNE